MKKILAVSLALNVAFLAVLSWKELTADAASGGGVPVGNGDVNGDGTIDISDAVYTLSWLFMGGKAPVAIPAGTGQGLPATGQTKSYYAGDDGTYEEGCPSAGRFVDHGDGTVTDTCTGLMWQKATAPGEYNWWEAIDYCEGLTLGGHSDWRLPNVRELQSIVDYGRWDPAIDPVFEAESAWYWSSTSDGGVVAWVVYFLVGRVDGGGVGSVIYVRAVRTGP